MKGNNYFGANTVNTIFLRPHNSGSHFLTFFECIHMAQDDVEPHVRDIVVVKHETNSLWKGSFQVQLWQENILAQGRKQHWAQMKSTKTIL